MDANAHRCRSVKKTNTLTIKNALADQFAVNNTTGTKNGINADVFADNCAELIRSGTMKLANVWRIE